ncbi:MAG: Na+/H+ antiporter [Bryobacteraceae bacterium]
MQGVSHVELLLLALLLAVAALAVIAKWLTTPYPIILVVGGLLLSLIPKTPHVILNPSVVFFVLLPPLLFSAAFQTSWREFRRNLPSILMLAFGLVAFTVFGVAAGIHWIVPGFDWKLGMVLGAVVATTDPISATATARRLGIPQGITDLIEAESLVNDGSGLVALKFTAALLITGQTPSALEGAGQLFYLIFFGTAIGLCVGQVVRFVQSRISEASIEITISLITPYIAYLTAEAAHCSGVMATLACGIFLGRRSSGFYSLNARIDSTAVWRTLDFILNGFVFLVLGLQLPTILAQIQGMSIWGLLLRAGVFTSLVIMLRMVWVYPGAWLVARFTSRAARSPELFSPRAIFLVGWSGMRGVLALAAAFSLPETLNDGTPFPHRNLIIFFTFCVIFVTLVVQGLTLPPLIRRLGLSGAAGSDNEEQMARREMIAAALRALDEIRQSSSDKEDKTFAQLSGFYRRRLAVLDQNEQAHSDSPTRAEVTRHEQIAEHLRQIERDVALRLRNENKIHDEVWRHLERELDLLDARFRPLET